MIRTEQIIESTETNGSEISPEIEKENEEELELMRNHQMGDNNGDGVGRSVF